MGFCSEIKKSRQWGNLNEKKLFFRQVCNIESASRENPNRDVFIVFVSPVGFPEDESDLSPLLQVLQSYPNIYLRNSYLPKLVEDTPVKNWFNTGILFKTSIFPLVHLSDFCRLLLLYKYGGTYYDLDVISLRSLDGLLPNFFPREMDWNPGLTGNAVINFQGDSIGHEMASIVLQ